MAKDIPHQPTNGPVSWVALVMSVLALLLASRTYINFQAVEAQLNQAATEVTDEIQDAFIDIRASIANSIRSIDANIPNEALVAEIQDIRAELAVAIDSAEAESRQELQELDQELEQIEAQARTDSAGAIQALQKLLESLEQDLEQDAQSS